MTPHTNTAGAYIEREEFAGYTTDLAIITKAHMLDVFDYGSRDLSHLLIRAALAVSYPELVQEFTEAEKKVLYDFARRGEQHFRWSPPAANSKD